MSSSAPQPFAFDPQRRRRRVEPDASREALAAARLDAASVEAVARRVVELLRHGPPRPASGLVDAKTLAAELGVQRSWVYAHRDELAHIRLGRGGSGRLRFDLDAAREAFARRRPDSDQLSRAAAKHRPRNRARSSTGAAAGSVLRVRGLNGLSAGGGGR